MIIAEILRVGTASGFTTGAYDSSDSFTSAQPKVAVIYHFTPEGGSLSERDGSLPKRRLQSVGGRGGAKRIQPGTFVGV